MQKDCYHLWMKVKVYSTSRKAKRDRYQYHRLWSYRLWSINRTIPESRGKRERHWPSGVRDLLPPWALIAPSFLSHCMECETSTRYLHEVNGSCSQYNLPSVAVRHNTLIDPSLNISKFWNAHTVLNCDFSARFILGLSIVLSFLANEQMLEFSFHGSSFSKMLGSSSRFFLLVDNIKRWV